MLRRRTDYSVNAVSPDEPRPAVVRKQGGREGGPVTFYNLVCLDDMKSRRMCITLELRR